MLNYNFIFYRKCRRSGEGAVIVPGTRSLRQRESGGQRKGPLTRNLTPKTETPHPESPPEITRTETGKTLNAPTDPVEGKFQNSEKPDRQVLSV